MNVIHKLFCITSIFLTIAISAKAQTNKWTELPLTNPAQYQAKGVTVKIFKETYSGLEGQQYTVKFTNISTQKLKIVGSLTARTYCGNALSITIDVAIKPGESLGGNDYLMDNVGLTGTVHTDDCRTDKIYPNPNDKNTYKYDRIRGLTLGSLMIMPVADPNAAAAERQVAATATKPVVNATISNVPVVKNTAPVGQNNQQAVYQQQANNYINAANNSTEDISKATNLNLAKINAAASGNKAQVAQIQQVQDQQMQDQIQSISTSLVTMLMNSKSKREREHEKYEAEIEKIASRMQTMQEGQANRHSIYPAFKAFRQKKQDTVDKILNYIRADFQQITAENNYAAVLQHLYNANMRFSRIDQIKDYYNLSYVFDRKNNGMPIYKEYGSGTIDYASDPTFDMANPLKKARNGARIFDLSVTGLFRTNDLYAVTDHYAIYPPSLKTLGRVDAAAVGAFTINYYNGTANMYNVNDRTSQRNFVKNYMSASGYFNQLPGVDKADTSTYFKGKSIKINSEYINLGNIGLKQMLVYEMRGEMSYDSAYTTKDKNSYIAAFQSLTKSTDYYSANLKGFVNRAVPSSESTRDQIDAIENEPYHYALFNTLNNLLIITNTIVSSPSFTEPEKKLYVERCVKSFVDCYF